MTTAAIVIVLLLVVFSLRRIATLVLEAIAVLTAVKTALASMKEDLTSMRSDVAGAAETLFSKYSRRVRSLHSSILKLKDEIPKLKEETKNEIVALRSLLEVTRRDLQTERAAKLRIARRKGDAETVECMSVDRELLNMVLIQAVCGDLIEEVAYFLERGADVNAFDADGMTPLFWAVTHGHTEMISFLVEIGAKVDVSLRDSGLTPLHRAAATGQLAVVAALIDHGADVNARAKDGETPLMEAATWAHSEVVAALAGAGASVDEKNKHGQTALALAIRGFSTADRERQMRTVEVLIDGGADVNTSDCEGEPPLICAARHGNADLTKVLLGRGADLSVRAKRTDRKDTVLMAAIESYLGWTPNLDTVGVLIEAGADVNAVNEFGATALMNAAWGDWTEIVKLLLANRAEVNARDYSGGTVLMKAASSNWHEDYKDKETVRGQRLSIVQALSANGAEINATDNRGDSALIIAARSEIVEVVEALLDHGADVNAQNSVGETALLKAVESGRLPIVEMLLSRGASVSLAGAKQPIRIAEMKQRELERERDERLAFHYHSSLENIEGKLDTYNAIQKILTDAQER